MTNDEYFLKLKENISKKRRLLIELESLIKNINNAGEQDRGLFTPQIDSIKESIRKSNEEIPAILEKITIKKTLPFKDTFKEEKTISHPKEKRTPSNKGKISLRDKPLFKRFAFNKTNISALEKQTLKRIKNKKERIVRKKIKKPNPYVKFSNKLFFDISVDLSTKDFFKTLKNDIIKSNLQFVLTSYIATILFSTLISIIFGIGIFVFFLFFNFGASPPFITGATEELSMRFLKVFWIIFIVPISTFLFMYFYPSMEKKSLENKINQELPFAAIHMFAISGSMIDPTKIFSIIIKTNEYPSLGKELTKLINEINIYGYDLVSALRNIAFNNPSKKLSELFTGLATTITSGGDLREFFDKRSQGLLFDHRLEREKYTKSAETFMDIYISVVIAAPMILMLLLIMIKISGLGIALSTSAITLIMILGVGIINVIFLTFLHLKQPTE